MQILVLLGTYVLSCCGGICHQPYTFIKIGYDHTVVITNYLTYFVPFSEKMSSNSTNKNEANLSSISWLIHACFDSVYIPGGPLKV